MLVFFVYFLYLKDIYTKRIFQRCLKYQQEVTNLVVVVVGYMTSSCIFVKGYGKAASC